MDMVSPNDKAAGATVTYTGTAGVTSTFLPGARGVLVWTTTDAFVRVGEAVTAVATDTPMPAYTPMVLEVPSGTGAPWRVSAIQISAGGSVFAKPVAG